MEEGLSNPVFTAGQEIAAFRDACERLSNDGKESWEESDLKAWKESLEESHLNTVISLGRVTSKTLHMLPSLHFIQLKVSSSKRAIYKLTETTTIFRNVWKLKKKLAVQDVRALENVKQGQHQSLENLISRRCNKDGKRSQHFSRCFLGRKQLHDVVG
uniref:Uncharacterized protein n=1 Tax=Picea sitchensis TaxID=3332 RepID=A9NP55_PICSI|nr:unknown [Picea sitchensis]